MDSAIRTLIFLKNLEAFIKNVPIDPKLPNSKEWEKNRAEIEKALKDTNKMLLKQGYLKLIRPCGKIPSKGVFMGPVAMCGSVAMRRIFPQQASSILPDKPCPKIIPKMEPFRPAKKLK